MNKLLRNSLLAASFTVFALAGQAQVITTTTGFNGSTANANGSPVLSNGNAYTQTFSFTGTVDLETVTFRFLASTGLVGSINSADLSYSFSTWDGANAVGSEIGSGVISVSNSGWDSSDGSGFSYFDSEVDLSGFDNRLSSSLTYGLTVFGNSATGVPVNLAAGSIGYADGAAFSHSSATSFGDLSSGGATFATTNNAFAFTANFTPVPEASSAAVLFAGLFVGGLMFRRRRHLGSVQSQA